MANSMVLRLEYSSIFNNPETVDAYLSAISRTNVLLIGSAFAARTKKDPVDWRTADVLGLWFSQPNNALANSVYSKLEVSRRRGAPAIILNTHTSLKLLERGFGLGPSNTVANAEAELRVFKAYLLLNELDNNKDNEILESLKDEPKQLQFPLLILTQTFRYADITTFGYSEVFSDQVVKAVHFLEFCEKEHPHVLLEFLNYYGCKTWQHYIQKLLPLIHNCLKNSSDKATDIEVRKDEYFEENVKFIDKLSFQGEVEELKDFDFVSLRSKPLFRKEDGTYRVIFDLFVFEKVFNSIYFTLRSLPALAKVNLKDIFTLQFSERVILYQVLRTTVQHSCLHFSGDELAQQGVEGAPDYYIRRRGHVFLFESKDVILNAEIKESTSFEVYQEEIKKKLYFDDTGKKTKPKAVIQLVRNIRNVLTSSLPYDSPHRVKRVYPIIVVHSRQFNVGGLNHLVNLWFRDELRALSDEGLNVKLVSQLTIVNSATLIHYSDYIDRRRYPLNELIERYHRAISITKNVPARSEDELKEKLLARIVPFSLFISKLIPKVKGPQILKRAGKRAAQAPN